MLRLKSRCVVQRLTANITQFGWHFAQSSIKKQTLCISIDHKHVYFWIESFHLLTRFFASSINSTHWTRDSDSLLSRSVSAACNCVPLLVYHYIRLLISSLLRPLSRSRAFVETFHRVATAGVHITARAQKPRGTFDPSYHSLQVTVFLLLEARGKIMDAYSRTAYTDWRKKISKIDSNREREKKSKQFQRDDRQASKRATFQRGRERSVNVGMSLSVEERWKYE